MMEVWKEDRTDEPRYVWQNGGADNTAANQTPRSMQD